MSTVPWSFPTRRLLPVPTLMVLACSLSAEEQKPTEVIVVNATKQSEEQHRLPASVTAVTEAQLSERSPNLIAELWQLNPNLVQFTDKPNGQLWVRGIGSGELPRFGGEENPTRGRNPAIVLYVDGAPVDSERGLAAFDAPLDLEQVELLRGPQGTLYGRNALGGVVSLHTRDPGAQAEIDGRVFYGTDNELHVSAAGGGPLTDLFGVRLAAGYSRSDGSLKNVTTGDDNTAGWDRYQARGKAVLHASDVLDLRLTVAGSKYDGSTDVWVPFDRREDRETVTNAPSDDKITGGQVTLQADWHLDKADTVTAVLSASRAEQEVEYDSDRSALALGTTDGSNTADNATLEVRWTHHDEGPLRWLAGVYASQDRIDYETHTNFSAVGIPPPLSPFDPRPPGMPYYMAIGQAYNYQKKSETTATSAALFGEATWDINVHWALTVGARLSYESSDLDWQQSQQANPGDPFTSTAWSGDKDEFQLLPKAALAYHVDDDRTIYASVSEGYRPGGLNTNATSQASAQLEYDAEYTWNYELGLRSLWLERSLAFNLTGFYIDWHDPQVFTERAQFDVVETNAERSHVMGAEAELRYRSTMGIGLWANGGLMKTEFDNRTGQEFDNFGVPQEIVYDGNRFANIPEWTWALGGVYQHTSGFFVQGDVHGHSWTYVDDKNEHRADGVALLDARIGFAASKWSVALSGRNLTDETDVLTSITLPPDGIYTGAESTYVRLSPARSVGVEVSAWW